MEEPIRLITDKRELEGTCYFELLPGPYQDRCWNDQSVFMAEEVFGFLEPIIKRQVKEFDHYAFIDVPKENWTGIINDFRMLRSKLAVAKDHSELRGDVGFLYSTSEDRFSRFFRKNTDALMRLIDELDRWLTRTLMTQEVVAILGI